MRPCADGWGRGLVEACADFLDELVAAFLANVDSFPRSDVGLAGGCDDTSHTNDFSHTIALEFSELLGVLVGLDLNLEFGGWLKIWVSFVIQVSLVDGLNGCLEDLDILLWIRSKVLDEVVIESLEVLHVNFEMVVASLRVALKLVPVDEGIRGLAFPNEVHEFVFGFN